MRHSPSLVTAIALAALGRAGTFAFLPDGNFRRRDCGRSPRPDAEGFFTDSRGRRYRRDPKTGQVRKA